MIKTSFTFLQLTVLFISVLTILFSLHQYSKNKIYASIVYLTIGTLGINVFMALLDPFLNDWDERFHALVAKNIMDYPLKPMLFIEHPLNFTFSDWTSNEVWLHKQPLFLWQIAIFFKLFGVNEFVLRLPNAIMGALLVPVIFDMGKLLFNVRVGFIAAFLFALSNYHLEMIAGVQGMEHNTFAFIFYVTLSIWAWIKYMQSQNKYWLVAVGIFSAGAVLNKWLTGLLVFGIWGTAILADKNCRFVLKNYIDIIISFIISLVIFLPWQIFILFKYPTESTYEFAYNSKHIFEVVEGHAGSYWFYIKHLPLQYGVLFAWLIPLGYLFFLTKSKKRILTFSLTLGVLVVFIFFSIIAQSKLHHYTYMIVAIMYLALASFMSFAIDKLNELFSIEKYTYLNTIALILIGLISLNINSIERYHTAAKKNYYGVYNYRENKIHNTEIYKKLSSKIGDKNYIVFNTKHIENVDLSFYSGIRGYSFVPDESTINKVVSKGYSVAIFNAGFLPEYILNDSRVLVLNEVWK